MNVNIYIEGKLVPCINDVFWWLKHCCASQLFLIFNQFIIVGEGNPSTGFTIHLTKVSQCYWNYLQETLSIFPEGEKPRLSAGHKIFVFISVWVRGEDEHTTVGVKSLFDLIHALYRCYVYSNKHNIVHGDHTSFGVQDHKT